MFQDVLLTVDFDRTLTASDGKIPERNLEAIRWFMENGGTFTVNTGRSVPSFGAYMDKIPVNAPFLLYNGSAAWGDGKIQYMYPIQMDTWEVLHKMEEEFPGLNVEVQGLDNHYLLNPQKATWELYDAMQWPHAAAVPGQDLGPFLKFSVSGIPDKNKLNTWFEGTEQELRQFDRIEQRILELYGDKMEVFRAAARIIDVHAKGVSKIHSARRLQKDLGKKLLVCVGDAENDRSMLEGADYSFCPSDGVVANDFSNVCPCGQGAVADVIYKKIPEILGISIDID